MSSFYFRTGNWFDVLFCLLFTGIDPKIFEGVDAAKVFAEIEAEKTRVSAQIESVTAEIAEIASLLEQAEIAAKEMEAEMSRQRFESSSGGSGGDHLDAACDQCDLSDEQALRSSRSNWRAGSSLRISFRTRTRSWCRSFARFSERFVLCFLFRLYGQLN